MLEAHQKLVEQYNSNKMLVGKGLKKTLILEGFVVAIVCFMKAIQKTASVQLNIIGVSFVILLLVFHFCDFKKKRLKDSKIADIIVEGVDLEKRHPFQGLSFFRDYLKEFSIVGKIAELAIFDFIFLYFFSVSVTQLIKACDPEIVAKLASTTPIRTFVISAFLGWLYYQPLRPLVHLKRSVVGSRA